MNNVTVKMLKMKFTLLITAIAVATCYAETDTDTYWSKFIADLWLEGADVLRIIWRDCSKNLIAAKVVVDQKEYFPKFVHCIKRKTLRALDRSLSPDVVPIADGVNLVRFELVDQSGNIIHENYTSTWTEQELEEGEWRNLVLQRMAKMLRTHVIKIDFDDVKAVDKVEYRGRRRYHMMTMMMFGIVSIGMVLIPMGFQFLAVLGGKALLLAKMALILASIQGLKKVDTYDGYHERGKIAASPLSYGFYHSFPPYEHFDKRSRDDWHNQVGPTQAHVLNRIGDYNKNKIILANNGNKGRNDDTTLENRRMSRESMLYPIHLYSADVSSQVNVLPSNTPFNQQLVDLTSRPGEVQADYTLDLPYNGFHFQSPTPVVPA